MKGILNIFPNVSHTTTTIRCRVDSQNHLSNTWMPIKDNAQLISIIYKASHILKKDIHMRHHIPCPRHRKPLEIYDSRHLVPPPIAELLHTFSLEMCHQQLLLFSFLENQLSKQHMIKKVLDSPIFIERQCRLASWIRNFKHILVHIKHSVHVLMCSSNIRLSMLDALINFPIAYFTTQFCA